MLGDVQGMKANMGKVFVYNVLSIEEQAKVKESDFDKLTKEEIREIRKLKNLYLPYKEELCVKTLEYLSKKENQQLNEEVTVKLVNEILGKEEDDIWNGISGDNYKFEDIRMSWRTSVEDKFWSEKFIS